jgi:4-alpha-glucanotransferase
MNAEMGPGSSAAWWHERHWGVLAPLFSLRGEADLGIGDLSLMPRWIEFLSSLKASLVMTLPLHQLYDRFSPYGAISLFAKDALLYADLRQVPDLSPADFEDRDVQLAAQDLRTKAAVEYFGVRTLRRRLWERAFAQFQEKELGPRTPRAQSFFAYVAQQADWIEDYALFHAMLDAQQGLSWQEWEPRYRDRDPSALAEFRREQSERILFYQYLQWIFDQQWERLRSVARQHGVFLIGDEPIYPHRSSAEVWTYRDSLFQVDLSAGAPPDQFCLEGQNWNLPPYRWLDRTEAVIDFWKRRMQHAGRFFDGVRLDHLLGFFGEWIIPPGLKAIDPASGFVPAEPAAMTALGERVLTELSETARKQHLLLIGEDLGTRPKEVRARIDALPEALDNLFLYHVIGWREGAAAQKERMLIANAVHDSLPTWMDRWQEMLDQKLTNEQQQVQDFLKVTGFSDPSEAIAAAFASKNLLVSLTAQELFGWTGPANRINIPGLRDPKNWTWRFPLPLEHLSRESVRITLPPLTSTTA